MISKIENAVNKTIILDYGQTDKDKLTKAVDKAQQEVRKDGRADGWARAGEKL